MTIEIQNRDLATCINFLNELNAKGATSRSRSKLIKLLMGKLKETQESAAELAKEYCELDEAGNPKTNDQGVYTPLKGKRDEYNKEMNILYDEISIIKGGEYANHIDAVEKLLLNYDSELDRGNAQAYDLLLDAFENARKEKGGE